VNLPALKRDFLEERAGLSLKPQRRRTNQREDEKGTRNQNTAEVGKEMYAEK